MRNQADTIIGLSEKLLEEHKSISESSRGTITNLCNDLKELIKKDSTATQEEISEKMRELESVYQGLKSEIESLKS